MSASRPKADIYRGDNHVSFGPPSDIYGSRSRRLSTGMPMGSWLRTYCDQPQDQSVTLTCPIQLGRRSDLRALSALSNLRHYASWAKQRISKGASGLVKCSCHGRDVPKSPFGTNE